MDEMECFEFWSFYVDIDIMRVYVVGADGHVSSCLCSLFLLGYYCGLTVNVLALCSLLVSF
jgi:hypothetical protein